ncbi:hypothetical protein CKAN_02339500 [Cinnamomum micranthum f. kanehirae]|uniref:Uncharacterized protein n=1 Tax=Cinnamomum micranthum f. kanehirae TaxID=337451 RepID=A0A3S3NTN0_9MAGN|nr:hypothetical protein CKAN_02339500 [Cinnamomum micranthum f. kanehirae]
MGCKGSKLDVASGNTIKNRLLRRKSDAGKGNNTNNHAVTEDDKGKLVEKYDAKYSENGVTCEKQPSNVKDIAVNTEGKNGAMEESEEGKGVALDSPDEYFSPKKGEGSVAESTDFHSPRSEREDGGTREDESSKAVELKGAEKMEGEEERHLVHENGKVEEDGKTGDKPSANLKEPNLVEKANGESTLENKANPTGEITEEKGSESSSTNDQSSIKELKKDGE